MHVLVVVCSFFEFGTVSKWCIRERVKPQDYLIIELRLYYHEILSSSRLLNFYWIEVILQIYTRPFFRPSVQGTSRLQSPYWNIRNTRVWKKSTSISGKLIIFSTQPVKIHRSHPISHHWYWLQKEISLKSYSCFYCEERLFGSHTITIVTARSAVTS